MALFHPFRALGYICDDVPFAVQRRGRETYVTVSVGKAWQVYNTNKLQLALIGPQLKHTITALACKSDLTFAAVRGKVIECRRVHRTGDYRGHNGDILQLLVLGDHLLSLGRDGTLLFWRIGEYDAPESTIHFSEGFVPTCMAHPDTYLNKVVVGGEDGRLQLWNFVTCQMLYEFASLGSAVRCIEPSPALDVVGIGLNDGRAVLHNLRYDEQVLEFSNASGLGTNTDLFLSNTAAQAARLAAGGACTSLAFRTGTGIPLMAAGGGAGVVTVWNLDQRRLHTVLRDAHDAPLVALHFFAGEPVLMSAGADNSLKQWIFDGPDGAPRMLRFRSGHSAPPTAVRYYADGKRLLSGGQDRAFRLFSTIQDMQSRELSQNHTQRRAKKLKVEEQELKLGRIIAVDTCDVRERDWSNVITAHEGDANAYVWRLQRFALGEHILHPPPKEVLPGCPPAAPVTTVALSRCGNFGFVGTANGRVDRYNMQSGLHRGAYRRNGPTCTTGQGATAHDGSVTGVMSDACNRIVVTAGLDGWLRMWDFKKQTLQGEVKAGSAIARIAHHPGTGLLAAACDDLDIRMYDIEARRLVRRFKGHTDRVTDVQLSEDCRWLISSSMDNTVRVWDVPGSRILQVLRLGSPVTSLSLSPTMDLLATAHIERNGIYLWANQLLFGSGVDIFPSDSPIDARLPSISLGRTTLGGATTPAGGSKRVTAMLAGVSTRSLGDGAAAVHAEDADMSGSDLEGPESSLDDSDVASASDTDCGDASKHQQQGNGVGKADEEEVDVWAARDAAGAPVPLVPHLVTLSMLPRTQWQNLAHLDVIKARNKPIEPPKKPEAAPFFLPTLAAANAGRDPVFDLESGFGGGGSVDGEEGGVASRVVRSQGQGSRSTMLHLLHSCAAAGDWTSLVAHLRNLPPSQIDAELQAMQLLDEDSPEMEKDLEILMLFLEDEVAGNANFDFVQALLKATLTVHGEAIAARPALKLAAQRIERRMGATWGRMDGLMQSVRCMVGLLGNLQP